ncbi:MAG: zinc ABC transporter substrate-binding protein [Deltaproteobacteria bacterium]|nr:zinc ABC transporter substrate-binding protein [Deltaproteobacteria bacterium]
MSRMAALLVCLSLLPPVAGCGDDDGAGGEGGEKVAVSIFPLYDIARRIAGDDLEVVLVLPPGRSEHSYDPSPREVAALGGTDLSVRVGLEMDDWLERIVHSASGDAEELLIGPMVDPRRMTGNEIGELDHDEEEEHEGEHHDDGDEDEHDDDGDEDEHHDDGDEDEHHDDGDEGEHHDAHHQPTEHGEHHHHHGAQDPHFWLDPVRMQQVADHLAEAFAELKPAAAERFRSRAEEVKTALAALHQEIQTAADGWEKKEIVTFHGSFGYFAERYGLDIAAVVEPFPGREPTPRYMREVLTALRATNAAALFSEPQLDPRPAQVIARESGKPLFELDPVGGTEGRESYEALMRSNLSVLNRALGGAN